MKIAYIIYNDITLLDFISIYDPISRLQKEWLPTLEWQVLGFTPPVPRLSKLRFAPVALSGEQQDS